MHLEHELMQTLGNVKAVEGATWDSLGQAIVLVVHMGKPEGQSYRVPVHMSPETAKELLLELQQVLAERADAGWTKQ